MNKYTLNELNEFLKKDKFFELTGVELLEVNENSATVGAKILQPQQNGNGVAHGGMLFTLADAAFGALATYLHPQTVTQSAQINYIAPGTTDYITATATELVRNGRNCIHQVIIKNKDGVIVCTATMNGFIKG